MTFADALKEQIEKRKATRRSKRLLEVINDKPSNRRTRILERLERHAKLFLRDNGHVQFSNVENVGDEWDGIKEKDWDKFFEKLLKFLTAILPLLLMFI